MEEDHVNVISSDDEDNTFLTEEEQRMFSSKPNEKSYEDSEDYKLGFEMPLWNSIGNMTLGAKGVKMFLKKIN